MGKLVVIEHLTLDGVMQAPVLPDEDPRGGFAHGGWALAGQDPVTDAVVGEAMGEDWAMLLGRVSYEIFAGYWPAHPDEPGAEGLNAARKYVVSRTLTEPLAWSHATLWRDDLAALKRQEPRTLVVFGSGVLVRSLLREGLVDELVLMVHPITLGSGRRLFAADGDHLTAFAVVDASVSPAGVVVARYRLA